jgi:hypothetical protein
MRKIRVFLIGLFVILLICCGGTVRIITYVNDLIETASNTDGLLFVTANIVVESLKDEADINFLRQNLNSFSNEQIVKYNYSDSISFDIKIPLINEQKISTYNFEKDLLYIIASEQKNSYDFCYKFNEALINKIDGYVYSTHYQHIDFKDFDISIVVDNDIKNTVRLTAFSVYINGQPYPYDYVGEIQRRERIEIQISEILRYAVLKNNNNIYMLFKIDK